MLKATLKFNLEVETEQRSGYFAAKTKPFAITVYSDKEDKAEERALKAVLLLLKARSNTPQELSAYLDSKGVKHVVHERQLGRQPFVVRSCMREMRVEVPAGV